MNKTLFWSTTRRSSRLMIAFALLLIFYQLVTMGTFPGEGGDNMYDALPAGMKQAFGITDTFAGLTGFMAVSFYGMTFVMFLMIYCVLLANQLISHLVDRGSMAYLLTTPVSRAKIAATQAGVLIGSLFLMTAAVYLLGLVAGPAMIDGASLDAAAFAKMNLTGFLLFFAIGGYSFFFSCLFNESKLTLGVAGLISVLFYVLHLASNMTDGADWLSYLTVLSAFRPAELAQGGSAWPAGLGLAAAGLLFYAGGIAVFSRRDLPL